MLRLSRGSGASPIEVSVTTHRKFAWLAQSRQPFLIACNDWYSFTPERLTVCDLTMWDYRLEQNKKHEHTQNIRGMVRCLEGLTRPFTSLKTRHLHPFWLPFRPEWGPFGKSGEVEISTRDRRRTLISILFLGLSPSFLGVKKNIKV